MRPISGPMCVALLLLLTLATGCSSGGATRSLDSAATGAEGEDARRAPDFTIPDIHGQEVRLADSGGSVRLVDFWATWCAPCREEIPMLKELNETYREQGLTILAISDEDSEVIREFAEENEIPYPNLVGTEELASEFVVLGLPTAYLIDGEGRIVESFFGPKSRKDLEGKIRELLELPPLT